MTLRYQDPSVWSKVRTIFPGGVPKDISLASLNVRLARYGLLASTKNPGSGNFSIDHLNSLPNLCYGAKCKEPLCRKFHGVNPFHIAQWYERAAKDIHGKSELAQILDRALELSKVGGEKVKSYRARRLDLLGESYTLVLKPGEIATFQLEEGRTTSYKNTAPYHLHIDMPLRYVGKSLSGIAAIFPPLDKIRVNLQVVDSHDTVSSENGGD